MSLVAKYGVGYSATAPSEAYLLLQRKDARADGRTSAIVCLHGHGGNSLQFLPNANPLLTGPGYHAWQLAEAGYVVLAIDAAGVSAWSDAAAMARVSDAVTFLGTLGAYNTKVGVMGWSMGGLTALNWIKRNPALVACAWTWSAVVDLDWAEAQGPWTAEVDSDFSPFVTAAAGYKVHDEPQSWRGVAPITICHADDDATVPASQPAAFVTSVADPLVTLRRVTTGGHSGLFAGVSSAEVIQHFKTSLT